MEQMCITSFLHHGYEFHLYTYQETEGIPTGTLVLDGNSIIPASRIFTYREHKTYAGFANFFRYKLLLEKGGWFVDADTVCLKPFTFPSDYVFSSEGLKGTQQVNLAAIKAPAGSRVAEYCWAACQEFDTSALKWSQCGPQLLKKAVEQCALEQYVQPPRVFCPIHFSNWKMLMDPNVGCDFTPETCAIHLWNELWRREGVDKDECHPQGCIYEELKSRYL